MPKQKGFKAWAKRNQDAIILVTVGTVVIGLVIVGIKTNITYQEQMLSELNTHIDQLNALANVQAL